MINPNAFLGLPIKFKEICTVYPPKVNDVLSNPQLLQLSKILTYSQEDIEDLLSEMKQNGTNIQDQKIPTPLEFLLVNAYQNTEFRNLVLAGFEAFIHEPVTLLYNNKMILIGEILDLSTIEDFSKFRYLSEETFFDFQNSIRASMGKEPVTILDETEQNPVVKRVKAAARRRERLKQKNKKGESLTTILGAICCMGIGLTPLNIGEISYASIDVLVTLYQQKEKYQADLESLWAGANPKKVHPKYWIREKSDFNEIKI